MWQGEPPKHPTLPPNDQQLLAHCNRADRILCLFCVVKCFRIVHVAEIRFLIDKPTNFPPNFTIAWLSWRLKHCQPWGLTFVLPHVYVMFWADDYVGFWHAVWCGVKGDLFGLDDGADWVAEVNLCSLKLTLWKNGAEIALAFNLHQISHIFHVFFIGFCVPEDQAKLHTVRFLESKYQCSVG